MIDADASKEDEWARRMSNARARRMGYELYKHKHRNPMNHLREIRYVLA